jgi:hypothetical protein
VESVSRVNIVKKVKVDGNWKLLSIPRNGKGNYDWNAVPGGLYLIEWRAGGKRRRESAGLTAAQALEAQRRKRHELEGRKLGVVDRDVQFDPAKYGWNWVGGTTSWVIPTAFSLMALRKVNRRLSAAPDLILRIGLGTAMLLNRMCPGGGWNAGNSVAFGVPYSPYIDATSIALLSLRGHEDQPCVPESLSWLRRRIGGCPAPYSLAWGIVALAAYHDAETRIREVLAQANQALVALVTERIDSLDTPTLAISAVALEALEGDNVFEIAS